MLVEDARGAGHRQDKGVGRHDVGLQAVIVAALARVVVVDKGYRVALVIGVSGKALVVTENVDENVLKSARNIEGVTTTTATILSPYMILTNGKMVVDKAALAKIEEVFA